jgi:hypothetical protein
MLSSFCTQWYPPAETSIFVKLERNIIFFLVDLGISCTRTYCFLNSVPLKAVEENYFTQIIRFIWVPLPNTLNEI